MPIQFFSTSLDDFYTALCKQIREHIKQMPEAEFQGVDRDVFSKAILDRFKLADIPEFGEGDSPIQRGDPVFTQGSESVETTVYFPYRGDPNQFLLYCSTRPDPCQALISRARRLPKHTDSIKAKYIDWMNSLNGMSRS